jgi:phage host-nuclease inhibitor protein Gam
VTTHAQIWLTRHAESVSHVIGEIGEDSGELTENGRLYSMTLAKFIKTEQEVSHFNIEVVLQVYISSVLTENGCLYSMTLAKFIKTEQEVSHFNVEVVLQVYVSSKLAENGRLYSMALAKFIKTKHAILK